MRPAAILALLCAALPLAAENLVFNAGFELGDAGFGLRKFLRPEANKTMSYEQPELDQTTSVSGRSSLRIANPFAEQTELFAKEMRLEPNTRYNGFLYLKSSAPDYPVRLRILSFSTIKYAWGFDFKKDLQAGESWRRFDFTFQTPGPEKACEYFTLILEACRPKEAKGATLWLDNVHLGKDSPKEWSPAAAVEAAVKADKRLYTIDGETNAKLDLSAINNTQKPVQAVITLKVESANDGRLFLAKDFKVELQPGVVERISTELPLKRFDAYQASLALTTPTNLSVATSPASFAAIGLYERTAIDTDKDFCVGVNASLNTVEPPNWGQVEKAGFPVNGCSQEDYVAMLAAMGCRLVRVMDFRWNDIEPKEGVLDFSGPEREVEMTARQGIELMPALGGWLGHKTYSRMPEWLLPKCFKRSVWPYNNHKNGLPELPPEDAWRKHVKDVASHFKGRLKHYEIINEPNADYFPTEYLSLLKAAQEEIRASDPAAKVVGFCSSGDYGMPPAAFLNDCAKLGGLKYADIVSYHPYETPKYPRASSLNETCFDILRKYGEGRDIPLWNSELFYLTDKTSEPEAVRSYYEPEDAAQRFLLDLGDGLGQSICVEEASLWTRELAPHLNSRFGLEWIPSSRFVVYNALARHFEGAKPVDKILWSGDCLCYVYERKGRPVAAFWNYAGKKDVKLTLGADGRDLRLFDTLGNELEFPKDGLLPLSSAPLYLEPREKPAFALFSKEMKREEFRSLLKNAKLELAKPLELGAEARFVPKTEGGWELAIPIRNRLSQKLAGKIELPGKGSANFEIPPNKEASIPVPFAASPSEAKGMEIRLEVNGKSWCEKVDIAKVTQVLRPGETAQIGTGTMQLKCEEGKIKLRFEVKDASPSGEAAGRQAWEQDCIELFFDAEPERMDIKNANAYNSNVGRLFVLPRLQEGRQLLTQAPSLELQKATVQIAGTPGGYRAEIELPRSLFKREVIGFEAQIDDANTSKRLSSTTWNASKDTYKNRLSFGFLVLK